MSWPPITEAAVPCRPGCWSAHRCNHTSRVSRTSQSVVGASRRRAQRRAVSQWGRQGGKAQPFAAAEANESSTGSNIRNGPSSEAFASKRAFAKTSSRLSCCVMFKASERRHGVTQGRASTVPQMQRANPSFNRTSPASRLACGAVAQGLPVNSNVRHHKKSCCVPPS